MKQLLATLSGLTLFTAAAFSVPVGFTASLINANAAWPTGANINSGNPGDSYALSTAGTGLIDYEGERDVKNQRTLSQSFSVSTGLNVTDLYFGYVGGTNVTDSVQVRIFEVDDVHGLANTAGNAASDDVIFGFPVTGAGTLNTVEIYNQAVDFTSDGVTTGSTFKVFQLSVSGISLPARSGPAGYLISLYNPDTDGVLPFKWAIERDDEATNSANAGSYLGGRAFGDNDGSHEENDDWAFAVSGTPIPEPATTALILVGAVGGFVVLRRRR